MQKVAVLCIEQDKRMCQELLSHLALLRIDVWESASIGPGRSIVEETTQAILSSQVAVLLVSASWFTDPLIEYILPMLLIHESVGQIYLIPILLRSCLYQSSLLAHISPINTVPVAGMPKAKRDEIWVQLCEQIRTFFGDLLTIPRIEAQMTAKYLRGLYKSYTKHRPDLRVNLFSGSTNGIYAHGGGVSSKVLVATEQKQEVLCDCLTSTQVRIVNASASLFIGLTIG